ncbi:MAG: substrate-binding domain-containing protein [Prevotella sp.]|nr:substrate-binding domain-containing protein [Prevotellaceae bacterium]MDY3365773.1 substrate-binding domain-containing protein [Prevotella sp.]MDY3851753.1 substrate-binding domain-containing protein [Prevotella sp.]
MKKTTSYILVGLILSVLVCISCTESKRKDGRTDTYSSGVITFASDESFSPIIEEQREVFQSIYREAQLIPFYTTESEGMDSLLQGKVQLVITSRDFKKAEKQNFIDRQFMPQSVKLAYDGLALIVNKSNTDTCISVKDIAKILTGEARKWSDLYPGSTRGDIHLVFDNKKSSTVHFAEDSILGGKPITNPNVVATNKTADVIDYVEHTPGAIGIIGSNWLNDKRDTTNLTFKKNIRTMSVSRMDKATPANSWKPYQYYIYNGNYPLIRTIYALLNDPYNGLPWGFAQFIASPKGQMIVFKSGLLPVQGDITIRDVNISQ